ncbi:hypothetical protein SAMN04489835_3523 [Mycolicibacterium rutilum]|uniref:Cysteine-rich secretory protein family protein n=1 Tax=Mycolicibacterium rutilum TaxID=370526 RepID=A0A1H6KFM5_MYCRU|nr:CAP domain-containing protein [Mycolicibacterium rutilum]SEH74118.1 hypothetical protein SAMN04489835_3523 [Mycolicibacterium rutilum]
MSSRRGVLGVTVLALACGAVVGTPAAGADNKRLNDAVVSNVYTVKTQAGCDTDIEINPKLRLAAEWHTNDALNNRALNGDIGSDGTTVADRARNAGYVGDVAETVAINPALAISGIELINQWYHRPDYYGIMSDCSNVDIGVWSANAIDRTVVVAVYGKGDAAPPVPGPRRPFGQPGAGAPG